MKVSAASPDRGTGLREKGGTHTHTDHGLQKVPGHSGRWGGREGVSRLEQWKKPG